MERNAFRHPSDCGQCGDFCDLHITDRPPQFACLVPRHAGKSIQPQNALPALRPCFAVRRTMGLEQIGHSGCTTALGRAAIVCINGCLPATGRSTFACLISSMLRPLAKALASSVKLPEVTTKPPAAPFAAMTP